jgi:hypothetical protein
LIGNQADQRLAPVKDKHLWARGSSMDTDVNNKPFLALAKPHVNQRNYDLDEDSGGGRSLCANTNGKISVRDISFIIEL